MRREFLTGAAAIALLIDAGAASAQQKPGGDQAPSLQLQNKEQDQGIRTGEISSQKQAGSEADAGEVKTLSPDQRAKVHQALLELPVERVTQANFPVKLGARVPETIKHHQLPVTVLDIAPRLRGYDYVLIGDRIAFINPGTREIVGVLG